MIGNPLLLTGGDYEISRSVRLRSSASAYFSRTLTTPTSQNVWSFSCWVKRGLLAKNQFLFWAGTSTTNDCALYFSSSDQVGWFTNNGSSVLSTSTAVFRDPSAWYHIVAIANSTTMNVYVNNQQVITNAGMTNNTINSAIVHNIGRDGQTTGNELDGYLTEVNFIDGQALTPSSFGATDAITGVWKPKKYIGTYGTNGFYLNFSDNSSNTATTIGKDYSGNGNNWTPNNISVTSGATYDSMLDVPTLWADGGNGRGNYCVLNPLDKGSLVTISDGNLRITGNSASNSSVARSTIGVSTGKWYWETTITTVGGISYAGMAIEPAQDNAEQYWIASGYTKGCGRRNSGGALYTGYGGYGAVSGITAASFTTGDVIGVAVDFDNGALYYSKNGVFENSGVPTSGSSKTGAFNVWTAGAITGFPGGGGYNGSVNDLNMGQRPFAYTPPAGFKALNTLNLPEPTIKKGGQYFNAVLWTGNATAGRQITGVGFQPDFVWEKVRSNTYPHFLANSVVGPNYYLNTNNTNAETLESTYYQSFNADGFTIGSSGGINGNGETFVAWAWKAGGSSSSNTSGSITSTVSANTTAGFSVVTFTGTGSAGTIGHGLGVAPAMVMTKSRSNNTGDGFIIYHKSLPSASYWLDLATTGAQSGPNSVVWNGTAPTSTVFSVGTASGTNTNTYTYVAYCFAAVAGYSAFGSYTGNGSANGPFVFCGFRPAFVMVKGYTGTSSETTRWLMLDNARDPYNATDSWLYANLSNAEATLPYVDFLSNGFKLRDNNLHINQSGISYIFAAFAENPFKNALAR